MNVNAHDPGPAPEPDLSTLASGPGAAAAPAEVLHFVGATDCGAVGLSMPRDADARGRVTGAEQVLRLAQAEPLIRAVEQWLQSAWDPSPRGAPASGTYPAVVRDPALAPPGTRLLVPLGALLVPPPEALRAPALAWGAHPAQLVLGSVPADALPQLAPAALLWLPASFGASWSVHLVDPAGRLPACPAQLDLSLQRLAVPPAGAGAMGGDAADPADEACVQLQRQALVPLDQWLGWGRDGAWFHWPVPQPWSCELRQGEAVRVRGSLLPVGAGCGMLVEPAPPVTACSA